MERNARRALIDALHREVSEYVAELQEIDDLDLWQEAVAKLGDVLVVYRRAVHAASRLREARTDEELRQMAFSHAVAEAFPELEAGDEWPEFMQRREMET